MLPPPVICDRRGINNSKIQEDLSNDSSRNRLFEKSITFYLTKQKNGSKIKKNSERGVWIVCIKSVFILLLL